MKFAELKFDKDGCCGSHNWAEFLDSNSVRVQVYDNGDGTFNVVKSVGNLVLSNQGNLTQEQVEVVIT